MNEFDSDGTCAPRALLLRSNAVHPRPHLNPLPLGEEESGRSSRPEGDFFFLSLRERMKVRAIVFDVRFSLG